MKALVRILAIFLCFLCIFTCLVGCDLIKSNASEEEKCAHAFGEWTPYVTNPYVQCEERIYLRSCTLCGEKETDYGSMLDHEFGEPVTTPPTCAVWGYDTRKCIHCGFEIKLNKTEPTNNHVIKTKVVSEANCGFEGCEYEYCTGCGYTSFIYTPKVGQHTFGSFVVHPDKHYYMCGTCGSFYNEGEHDFDVFGICSICGGKNE